MTKRLVGAALILSAMAYRPAAGTETTVDYGRTLAMEACSACHQVTPAQKKPAPVANPDEGFHVAAPAFTAIAAKCLQESDLRTKIASPHYPMREQVLGDVDLASLAKYIRSLAPGAKCAVR